MLAPTKAALHITHRAELERREGGAAMMAESAHLPRDGGRRRRTSPSWDIQPVAGRQAWRGSATTCCSRRSSRSWRGSRCRPLIRAVYLAMTVPASRRGRSWRVPTVIPPTATDGDIAASPRPHGDRVPAMATSKNVTLGWHSSICAMESSCPRISAGTVMARCP